MAMTTIFVVEAIVDLPLAAILVREEDPGDEKYATAFTLALLRCAVIAATIAVLAWPISRFYDEPRLVPLMLFASLAPIFRGMLSPRLVSFQRHFNYRPLSALDVASKIVSLVVVSAVVITTKSYWAIAAGTVTTSASLMAFSYYLAPMRPALTLSKWRDLRVATIGWNSVSQIIQAINWQLDRIILPKFIDIVSFGRFTFSTDLSAIPYQAIAQPVGGPLASAFVNASSPEELRVVYLRSTAGLVHLMAPILLTIGLLSEPLLRIVFGEKWLAAAPILSGLALVSMVGLPAFPMPPLALMKNYTHLMTAKAIAEFVVKLPVLLLTISAYGAYGAIVTQGIAGFAALIVATLSVRTITGLTVVEQCRALVPAASGLLVMAATIEAFKPLIIQTEPVWLEVVSLGGVGIVAISLYAATALGVWYLSGRADSIEAMIVRQARMALKRFA